MPRILIFDADTNAVQAIAAAAGEAGFAVVGVTEEDRFGEQLRIDPPDVIALGLQLGRTDGIAQLRALAERKFAGVVVLLSGAEPRLLDMARELGRFLGLNVADVAVDPRCRDSLEQVFGGMLQGRAHLTVARLRDAIANQEMSLDFQPVVTRSPRALLKLEALVRWNHPRLGRLPPKLFLPLAEGDIEAIDALTDWVMNATVDAYQALAARGICVPMSLNISMLNLHNRTFPDRLEQLLRGGNMPARHLHLETTGSVAPQDIHGIMEVLGRLRLKGVGLSISAFGTGYSCLKLLRQMPFSEIKIDRSFLHDLTVSPVSRTIVRSLIELSANLGVDCVAAGVESVAVADLLEDMGASSLQGNIIAPPMPADAIAAWCAVWTRAGVGPHLDPSGTVLKIADAPYAMMGLRDRAAPAGGLQVSSMSSADRLPGAAVTRVEPSHIGAAEGLRLPPRQLQTLQLLAEGCSVKEIARRLNLGVGTVKVHLSLAYLALGARNRTEAIRKAGPLLPVKRIGSAGGEEFPGVFPN